MSNSIMRDMLQRVRLVPLVIDETAVVLVYQFLRD
jgi:hypothetical protein